MPPSFIPFDIIHLLSKDVDDAILKLNGIVKEEAHQAEFKPITCPRCNKSNAPVTKLCFTCGFALDLKTSYEVEKKDEKINSLPELWLQQSTTKRNWTIS